MEDRRYVLKGALSILLPLLLLSAGTLAQAEDVKPAASGVLAAQPDRAALEKELKSLEDALPAKKKELARLHHKWIVAKGRMPTAEEVKAFEQKRAQGTAKFEDNPYVNKKPLSTPGRARQAYYRQLSEVQKDEARISELKKLLSAP
jgi:hypothetical protein